MKRNVILRVLVLSNLVNLCVSEAPRVNKTRPHVVFILADDLGWNDVGFHGSNQIPTPNIDALAYSGTVLHNYYSQPICTPSRSALLTGRHPVHNGMQTGVIYAAEPWGVPLSEKLLPEYLKELGYQNRAVGKWHVGFFRQAYTPTSRGFHSHFGYWLGHKDYYTHQAGYGEYAGYDLKRNLTNSWESKGRYTTDLFTEEAEQIIRDHDINAPLFLYLSHLAAHAPLQAPAHLVQTFDHIEAPKRRIFAAMVTKLDESVGRVVAALKHRGILSNSIIVFTSDNGGATHGYDGNVASNWPLRGGKDTLWEGGVRVPAVIWSPLLETTPAIHAGLMSVTDWLPTLLSAANGTFTPAGQKLIDGHNHWETLQGRALVADQVLLHNRDDVRHIAALRRGNWKIIKGSTYKGRYDAWYGKLKTTSSYDWNAVQNSMVAKAFQDTERPLPAKEQALQIRNKITLSCNGAKKNECVPKSKPCLFNIAEDPCENNNMAEQHPDILKELLALLDGYHPVPINNKRADSAAKPSNWNCTWTHWQDYPPPLLYTKSC